MDDYPTDSCAISSTAFLFIYWIAFHLQESQIAAIGKIIIEMGLKYNTIHDKLELRVYGV